MEKYMRVHLVLHRKYQRFLEMVTSILYHSSIMADVDHENLEKSTLHAAIQSFLTKIVGVRTPTRSTSMSDIIAYLDCQPNTTPLQQFYKRLMATFAYNLPMEGMYRVLVSLTAAIKMQARNFAPNKVHDPKTHIIDMQKLNKGIILLGAVQEFSDVSSALIYKWNHNGQLQWL